jgi:hypothetical protein
MRRILILMVERLKMKILIIKDIDLEEQTNLHLLLDMMDMIYTKKS